MKIVSQYLSMNKRWIMRKSKNRCKICGTNNNVYTVEMVDLLNQNSINLCDRCLDCISELNNKRVSEDE